MSSPKVKLGVAFDGEKEVKSAVSNINAQLKTLKSEAEKVKSAFEGQEKSEESLRATSKVLTSTLEVQRAKMKAMSDAVEKAVAHEKELAERKKALPSIIEEESRKLEEMKSKTETSSKAIEKQEEYIKKLQDELKKMPQTMQSANTNTEKWKDSLNKAETELNKTKRELDKTESELKDFADKADDAGDEMNEFGNSAGKSSGKLSGMAVAWGTFIGNLALDALKEAAGAIKDFAGGVAELGIGFDSSMSNVQALSGATSQELQKLTDTARQAGKTTVFSAQESADALSYMALAGWDTNQMVSGLPSVLNLAAAAQMDLAEASDIVTDNVTAFGLSAKDSSHFADVMAYAMAHSNTDVSMLGESYKNVASTAASMGFSVEDVTAALMTMANAGVKGGEAGNGLNAIMTRLATNTKGSADELEKYGIHIYDSEGKMSSLSDILIQTSTIWDGLTQKEQANLAKMIAGQNQYSKFQTVMAGLSDKARETGQSFEDYTEQLKNCDGAASDMSKVMNDNLAGDLKTLNSVTEDFKLTLYNLESGEMRNIVQRVSGDLIPAFEALVTGADDASDQIGNAFDGILDNVGDIGGNLVTRFFGEDAGAAVSDVFDMVGDVVKDFIGVLDDVGPIIGKILSTASDVVKEFLPIVVELIEKMAPVVHSVVESLLKAVSAILPTLSSLLKGVVDILGPILDLVTMISDALGFLFDGIGYVVDGIGWLLSGCPQVAENFEEVRDATDELNDSLGKSAKSWDSMLESQQKALAQSSVEIDNIGALISTLDDLVDENGKVKEGYEGRAQYIIDKLSEATGVEIECVDGTIQKYGELKKSIEDVMATKRAEALQNYYQKVLDTFEGGTAQLGHSLSEAKAQLAELETAMANTSQNTDEWEELNAQHQELSANIEKLTGQYETAAVAEANMYDLETAKIEGNTKKIEEMYQNRESFYFKDGEAFLETADEKVATETENLNQYIALQEKYKDSENKTMRDVTKTHVEEGRKRKQAAEDAKNAQIQKNLKALSQMKGDTSTFGGTLREMMRQIGERGGAAYAGGINSKSGETEQAGTNLKNSGASGASGSYSAFHQKGVDGGQGYLDGLRSQLQKASEMASGFVSDVLRKMAQVQQSNSPSKKTRKLGRDFGSGYLLGIEDEMKNAKDTVTADTEMALKAVSDVSVTTIPSLGVMNLFSSLSGQNLSLVSEISGLRSDLRQANLGVNTYNVNGVTYDDGSNVASAVQTLVRATRIERRV